MGKTPIEAPGLNRITEAGINAIKRSLATSFKAT